MSLMLTGWLTAGVLLAPPADILQRLEACLTEEAKARVGRPVGGLDPAGHELAQTLLRPLAEGHGPRQPAEVAAQAPDRAKREVGLCERLMRHEVSLLGGYEVQPLGDPIDWHRAPREDWQWPTHLSRHYWLAPLAWSWRATGNAEHAAKVFEVLVDWVQSTPLGHERLQWRGERSAGEGYPATREGFFLNYADGPWTSLSAHARTDYWSELLQLVWDSPAATNANVAVLLVSLATDHRLMMINFPRAMNQYQGIATSLVRLGWWYGCLVGADDAERIGWERMAHYATTEIYPDGSMAECSGNYAVGCLGRMWGLMQQARERGRELPAVMDERVAAAVRYFAMTADPAGRTPRIAKGGGEVYGRLRSINGIIGDPVAAWILSGGAAGSPPESACAVYPWAGHAVFRSGWGAAATWLFFEPGPRGSGHHDLARNSLQLIAGGQWLLTDPGYYSYSSSGEDGAMSRYLYSTAAHNTALVDELPQHPGRRGANKEPGEYHWFDDGRRCGATGEQSGFGRDGAVPVTHRRELVYDRETNTFEVVDTFTGEGERTCDLHWQIPVGAELATAADGFTVTQPGSRLQVEHQADQPLSLSVHHGEKEPHLGWFSVTYGKLDPANLVRVRAQGALPLVIRSRLVVTVDAQ